MAASCCSSRPRTRPACSACWWTASPDTDAVYLVPITDVPDRGACLRVKPTKNNQAKGVRWAKDYVLGDKVKVADAAG